MDLFDTFVILDGTITGGDAASRSGGNTQSQTTTSVGTADASAPAQQEEAASSPLGWLSMVVLYGGLFAALWFFMIRPQRKKAKQQKEMQEALNVGENVVTSSGFFGKIVGVGSDSFLLEFGESRGIRVWVRKTDILGVKEPVMTPPAEK